MASAVIHLCVAKEVNKYINMDEKHILLGSIAPDIAKQVGQTKEISHFLDHTNEDDIPNIERFLDKYRSELTKPFEMGYFIHLLTDQYLSLYNHYRLFLLLLYMSYLFLLGRLYIFRYIYIHNL